MLISERYKRARVDFTKNGRMYVLDTEVSLDSKNTKSRSVHVVLFSDILLVGRNNRVISVHPLIELDVKEEDNKKYLKTSMTFSSKTQAYRMTFSSEEEKRKWQDLMIEKIYAARVAENGDISWPAGKKKSVDGKQCFICDVRLGSFWNPARRCMSCLKDVCRKCSTKLKSGSKKLRQCHQCKKESRISHSRNLSRSSVLESFYSERSESLLKNAGTNSCSRSQRSTDEVKPTDEPSFVVEGAGMALSQTSCSFRNDVDIITPSPATPASPKSPDSPSTPEATDYMDALGTSALNAKGKKTSTEPSLRASLHNMRPIEGKKTNNGALRRRSRSASSLLRQEANRSMHTLGKSMSQLDTLGEETGEQQQQQPEMKGTKTSTSLSLSSLDNAKTGARLVQTMANEEELYLTELYKVLRSVFEPARLLAVKGVKQLPVEILTLIESLQEVTIISQGLLEDINGHISDPSANYSGTAEDLDAHFAGLVHLFCQMEPISEVYSKYAWNAKHLMEFVDTDSEWRAWLGRTHIGLDENKSLKEYISLPVDRLQEYRVYLDNILKIMEDESEQKKHLRGRGKGRRGSLTQVKRVKEEQSHKDGEQGEEKESEQGDEDEDYRLLKDVSNIMTLATMSIPPLDNNAEDDRGINLNIGFIRAILASNKLQLGVDFRERIALALRASNKSFLQYGVTSKVTSLARVCTVRKYEKGESIIKEGDPADECYVIVCGMVVVTKKGHGEIHRLEQGDSFGEIALILDDGSRTASCAAGEETIVFVIPAAAYLRHVAELPEAMSTLSLKINGKRSKIRTILYHSKASHAFLKFVTSRFAEESFEFWNDCRAFRQWAHSISCFSTPEAKAARQKSLSDVSEDRLQKSLHKRAKGLVDKYIREGAPRQVNISSDMARKITMQVEKLQVHSNVFGDAESEIVKLMSHHLPAFKSTKEFKEVLDDVVLFKTIDNKTRTENSAMHLTSPVTGKRTLQKRLSSIGL